TGRYLGNAFVPRAGELLENALHLFVGTSLKVNDRGLECAASGRSLVETWSRCDDEMWTGLTLDFRKERKPFRPDFRVGQDIFNRSEFRFRKKERGRMPVEQALVKQFLRMNAGTKNPNCLVDLAGDGSDEECLRRLDDVRELHRQLRSPDFAKFARDRLA